jgi:hypothetical protein
MLRLYKFGGGIWQEFFGFQKQKRILSEQDPLFSYLCVLTFLLY